MHKQRRSHANQTRITRGIGRTLATVMLAAALTPAFGLGTASASSRVDCSAVPLQLSLDCENAARNIDRISEALATADAERLQDAVGTFIAACTPQERVDVCSTSMRSLASSSSTAADAIPSVEEIVYVVESLPVVMVASVTSDGYDPISGTSDPLEIPTLAEGASNCPWGIWTSTARRTYENAWGWDLFWHNLDVKYEVKHCKVIKQYFATNTGSGQHGWSFHPDKSSKTVVGVGTPHAVVDGIAHFEFNYYWSHHSYDSHCWRDEYGNGAKPSFNCSN